MTLRIARKVARIGASWPPRVAERPPVSAPDPNGCKWCGRLECEADALSNAANTALADRYLTPDGQVIYETAAKKADAANDDCAIARGRA